MKTKTLILTVFIVNVMFASTTINTSNSAAQSFKHKSDYSLNVKINTGNLSISNIINDNNVEFIQLNLDDGYPSKNIGEPQLPQLNQLIEIPYESNIRIEIVSTESLEYDLNDNFENLKVYPVQPPVSKSADKSQLDFIYHKSYYAENKFTETELVEVINKGKLREVQIANVIINPIKYNPAENKLIIYHDIEFNVHFDNANIEETINSKSKYASIYFEPIFENSLINYNSPYISTNRDNNFLENKITYVIIANSSFSGHLDEFIDWKTKKGYDIVLAYTSEIGSSASAISSFIEQQYTSPSGGLAPATFVLLVGDTAQIPASYSSGGHVSDLDYCDFTGDDMPEVLCGRFSAQTPSHLLTQIEKTLEYEQFLMPDPSFLEDVIMISGVDSGFAPTYGNGQINYGNQYYFNNEHGINSNTFLYPASGSSGSQILNLANQGAAFINYTAHGWESGWADPEFDVNDANNMTNNNKYPTMVGICCLTNAFDTGTCFGEALLRKSNGGAIGYIGGSDVTYWDEDFWWGVGSGNVNANPSYGATGEGAYDGMFHENNEENWAVVNSAIIMLGNLAVAQANGMDDYYWEIYHLMGDPSLSTYLGMPEVNDVNYNPLLPVGSEAIEIQANPYSYIGLYLDGELISSGVVEESGFAVLVFNPINESGTIELTVTGQNTQPFFGEIFAASPDGAYVTISNVEINLGDDNTITPGESIDLTITLENMGNESSSYINVSLLELIDNPYINISDGSGSINNLSDGSIAFIDLSFDVSSDAPYGHQFALQLDLDSDGNSSSTTLNMTVGALVESFDSGDLSELSWDFTGGDEDWIITMGETYEGLYSSKSGTIDHSMFSQLSITIDVVEAGNISFYKKVSCEEVGSITGTYYDYLAFYIDDVEQEKWAGELGWSLSSFVVNSGEHTFTWKYLKDHAVNVGDDAVWLDYITFPPTYNDYTMLGDVNNDSTVNIQDIILTVNLILSGGEYLEVADMNTDGVVDILDVIIVVNIILQN